MFDRNKLLLKSLQERKHDLDFSQLIPLKEQTKFTDTGLIVAAKRMIAAKKNKAAAILMMGAHVIRSGVQRYLLDLMARGYISCLVMNGAGAIHDYELALIGATTESVARYIQEGQFGLWRETGQINDIINQAYAQNKNVGFGQAVGEYIYHSEFPFKDISLLAGCYHCGIPVLVSIGIGCDIIHEHPNCNGAAMGALSYHDFLDLAEVIQNLEHGIVLNFGSAVMAPEVYLKALSMARNVARQHGEAIKHFTTLVCDLHDFGTDFSREPAKDNPAYYFRPWKTMLIRTVADGGESFYVKGRHAETIPALWTAINNWESFQ
ncbi:MAG: hypothetical protein HZA78_00690 [Candidatus Schekmanbacteria bacterium]|nr:hypothetical protein [Candidatus Schekmanbacteria bacterium]